MVVTYTAGYLNAPESTVIPANPYSYVVQAPLGPWSADEGVSFSSSGVALTPVTGTPATGQYALPADKPGTYLFAAADTGKSVIISYSFTPADMYQAVIELAAERFTYKGRIGQRSKSLGGQETIAFASNTTPDWFMQMMFNYADVRIFPS